VQVSLYHHQLTQQFVAHACPLRPHEQSSSAEHAFNRGRSRWWVENLKECMQDFKCWVSPDYGPQFFRFFFTVHRCKTMVLDISHATLAYSVVENFRELELPSTRTRTFLEDNNTGRYVMLGSAERRKHGLFEAFQPMWRFLNVTDRQTDELPQQYRLSLEHSVGISKLLRETRRTVRLMATVAYRTHLYFLQTCIDST